MTDFSKISKTGGVREEDALDVISKGHPPIADGVILVDFDATIAPFGFLFDFPEPIKGAPVFMRLLKAHGYKVGIFTSRLSPTWLESAGQKAQDHIDYINEYAARYDFPVDFITAEKVPALVYVDDKAIEFRGKWADTTLEFIKRKLL